MGGAALDTHYLGMGAGGFNRRGDSLGGAASPGIWTCAPTVPFQSQGRFFGGCCNAKFFELNAGQLTAVIEPAKAAVTKEMVTAVAGGLMTRQQANAEYWHLLWQRVERNLKGGARLGYKREALYG